MRSDADRVSDILAAIAKIRERVTDFVGQLGKLRATQRVPRQPALRAGWQPNATRFF